MSNELPLDQQLAAALEAVTAAKSDTAKALADAKAATELAEQAQASLTAKADELAKVSGELATTKAALEAESTAKAAAEKAQAETAAKLEKLQSAVATNPAFADAAAGRAPVASAPVNTRSKEEIATEYKRLASSDPNAATEFYRANKAALLA